MSVLTLMHRGSPPIEQLAIGALSFLKRNSRPVRCRAAAWLVMIEESGGLAAIHINKSGRGKKNDGNVTDEP
jgi:hypothetical protein